MIELKSARRPETASEPPPKGRIVTFYSYKGGTGRSMALANVAWMLALNGQRVLVIDWDLEAPGVHRYFHPFVDDKELLETEGLLDFVENLAAQAAVSKEPLPDDAVDIIEYVHPLEWPRNSGSRVTWKRFGPRARIDLLPAGRQGAAYARKLATFNWIDFYERLQGRRLLEVAKAQMQSVYDYVLIDSRTGVSDTSGICTVEMPDTLVVCFTLNDQSIRGASAVAESVRAMRKLNGGQPFRTLPVPTRVEILSEQDKLRVALELAQKTFAPYIDHIPPAEHARYFGTVQMAYFPFYAFEEIPAVFGDKPGQLHSLSTSIKELTNAITGGIRELPPMADDEEESEKARKEVCDWYLRKSTDPAMGILQRFDQIVASFDSPQQHELLDALSRLAEIGEKEVLSARSVPMEAFADTQRRLVDMLCETKLLAVADTAGVRTVSFTEPIVLERWEPLRQWIFANRPMLVLRQTLGAALQSWRLRDSDESALLTGKLLEEASHLAKSRPGCLNADEHRFVQTSIDAARHHAWEAAETQKQNQELTRKLSELEQAARTPPAPSAYLPPRAPTPRSPWMPIAIALVIALLAFAYSYYESVQREREASRIKQQEAQNQVAAAQTVQRFTNAAWDALILVPGLSQERQDQYQQSSKWLANVQPDPARQAVTVRYFRKNDRSLARVNALLQDTWGLLGFRVEMAASRLPNDSNVIWAGSKVPPRDVKIIACTLLRAGVPIRAIGTYWIPDSKPDVIEIGYAPWAQKLPVWPVQRVLDSKSFTMTRLNANEDKARN